MKIDVVFLPAEARGIDLSDTICVVLDIFRATSSIVTAMANGCQAIIPVVSVEQAKQLAEKKTAFLLAGERQSKKIDGFDFGNSPFDFSRDKVQDRQIIMTTTNGTTAIKATATAYRTLIGSFINAGAVCRQAKQYGKDVLIVCAGTNQLFSLEDALGAGLLIDTLLADGNVVPTDAALGAALLYRHAQTQLTEVARSSRNGMRLYGLGRAEDIEYCLRVDETGCVPEFRGGMITLSGLLHF
ncbi:MAG: 2-phosphosulfolactate phosphatase [Sporomusa sp.]